MAKTYERRHSNGVTTKIREWPAGFDFGLELPRSGQAGVHMCQTIEEAKLGADQLAHPVCDERCSEWQKDD
jgi:hypothetical protein